VSQKIIAAKVFEGLLIEEDQTLCAMLDGASVPDLLQRLHAEPSLEAACLLRGNHAPDMRQVAPYLVKLEPESEFAEWVIGNGWGQHWGTFVTSRGGFRRLRDHLRQLMIVHRRDGTSLYFRYYDPRVMRVFLPTCSPAQLKQMFGPAEAFLAESESGDALTIYRLNGDELSAVQRKLA
jgi:hypothetical protein